MTPTSGRVCVVGSANLDLMALAARLPASGETVMGHGYLEAPGGKGLNQAIAAARAGAHVSLVGAVGSDDAGQMLRTVAAGESIDTGFLHTIEGTPTGRALIAVGDDGANLIVVVPGANDCVSADAVREASEVIVASDVLLVQHEIPEDGMHEALRVARAHGVTTILNPAPARPIAPEVLALVDIVVPNEHEYAVSGDLSAVPTVIVTEGERGSRVITESGEQRVNPFVVASVDSVAAGDAFCGVLAASLASGQSMEKALVRASAAGALATTVHGAVPSLPTAAQVSALIESAR